MTAWLKEAEGYSEKQWQRLIIDIVLLLFPRYVAVLENVNVKDFYSSPGKTKDRYIDLCLVDASGSLDIIEIKKPFDGALLSRSPYRGNLTPAKELAGSIMQAEKYIFHLSKWGHRGEHKILQKHGDKLPAGMNVKITNPKAMIILGRDRLPNGHPIWNSSELLDFEVIRRKYSNLLDVITYDDLLRRLNNIIASLERRRAVVS